jgi:hypothetical protein
LQGPQGERGLMGPIGPQGDPGLPGRDGISGYQVVTNIVDVSLGPAEGIQNWAVCPSGKVAIGGGATLNDINADRTLTLFASYPVDAQVGSAWISSYRNMQSNRIANTVIFYAVCAQISQ